MLRSERQNEIIKLIKQNRYVKVKELCDILYASESSIRRDLSALEKEGFIKRSYGAAEDISSSSMILPFSARSYECIEEKQLIAAKAVKLIKENDVVFLDQSSTCYFLALAIRHMRNITVVTNNIEIVMLLSKTNINVHCTGGQILSSNTNCLIGANARNTYESMYADLMFFSAKAISDDGVIWDCSLDEIDLRKTMLKNSEKRVFLCSCDKIGNHTNYVQCTLSDIDIAICNNDAFDIYKETFRNLVVI